MVYKIGKIGNNDGTKMKIFKKCKQFTVSYNNLRFLVVMKEGKKRIEKIHVGLISTSIVEVKTKYIL